MTTFTVSATELARIVRAVEKSAAKDDSRPILAGIHVTLEQGKLTATAADGFRLSTAHTTLPEPADAPPAILRRAELLAFLKLVKPKQNPTVSIETDAQAWTFASNGSRASVPTIDGTYPDFRQIIGDGAEPVLFAVNPRYFADVLASHGTEVVHVARAKDSASAPLFFTAGDGTRHVVMPMIVTQDAERLRRSDAPAEASPEPVTEQAPEPEPEPAPVTPEESAFRTIRAARERVTVKRAERRAEAQTTPAPERVASPAITCPDCGSEIAVADRYCGECGLALSAPNVAELAHYSPANQRRILAQCADATDVRGFRAWLEAGRVVRKGERGIRIHAPITATVDGAQKVVRIKPISVFDVSQTDPLISEAAA